MILKIQKLFDKKMVCQKCKRKLSKNEFVDSTKGNICIYCDFKEKEFKKRQESENNCQYIEKNCRTLFVVQDEAYVYSTSVGFDIFQKTPCIIHSYAFGPRDSLLYWSYSHIGFDELKKLAKENSNETYEKYKNMDESNWQQYIKQIEELNDRRLLLYTGNYQQHGFSSIILKFCPQPFGSKSWWELEWKGVLENQYGSCGSICLSEDFVNKCSAFDLYEHFKTRLNTNTEIPAFYDNEELVVFLKNIQS